MTDIEKCQIQDLRVKGEGYKVIATVLGITRDTVKGYCKRNGLEGESNLITLNLEDKINQNLICACCNKAIKQKGRGRVRRFCCDECRRKWWNENKEKRNKKDTATYKYTCEHCGKEFNSYGNKLRKYCTHDCYIKERFGEVDEFDCQAEH